MPSVQNKMDNKVDGHLLIIKASVDTNKHVTYELKQDNDELKNKPNKQESVLETIDKLVKHVLVLNQAYLPDNIDSPKS